MITKGEFVNFSLLTFQLYRLFERINIIRRAAAVDCAPEGFVVFVDGDGDCYRFAVVCGNAHRCCTTGIFGTFVAGFVGGVAPPMKIVGKRAARFETYFCNFFALLIKENRFSIFVNRVFVLIFKGDGENRDRCKRYAEKTV